ncbi:hypothetical protein [Flavobacterium sp. ov086]|uniref:hypothetical protein n=1 Tax=Flavobacterium sp. ov086 TaxID=1761785 RepID=UPI000B6B527E|nr:hypothetical protein [Flavobacterium sp. ov086]SNS04298.1 hypothetical protein SAMN04487979_1532 [Flavobacterium sp. ov086]
MKNLVIILCCCVLNSCNGQQNKDINIKSEKHMKDILKRQLQYGIPNYSNTYEYSSSDFEVIMPITKEGLKLHGLKFPSDDEFNSRIKIIFNRIIDSKSDSKYIYVNFLEKCDRTPIYFPNNIYAYFGLFVIKNDNYITESYALPQIIDYQKKFIDISIYENSLPKKSMFENREEVTRYLWKDEKNLVQQRKKNIDVLVNRNKYLFNDSKASLVWLKFNDQEFLESLVKTFGYVQDKDLLKWVLDRNLNDAEFDKVVFTKTCDNKYVFHKEIFEVMNLADTKSKEKYIAFLREHFPKVDKNNFSDETKIQALYCYYSTKLSGSVEASDVYSFFPRLNDEESEQEFKKNNYYNLSDFKELYNETRYSGVGPAE